MKNLIGLLLLLTMTMSLSAQEIVGDWEGVLEVQGTKLPILFHISQNDKGFMSTMDSPSQGANGIPMDNTSFKSGKLTITAAQMGMKFTSKVQSGATELVGSFNQGGMSLPLTMTRVKMVYTASFNEDKSGLVGNFQQNGMGISLKLSKEKVEKKVLVRPQEPKDFPYQQEEVKFKNKKGGHHLMGTLTIPANGNFEKVVVMVTGSGPQNRDEELLGHKPFLVISDRLTRQGIAVLRYGPGITISELMIIQTDLISASEGATEKQRARNKIANKKVFAYIKSNFR